MTPLHSLVVLWVCCAAVSAFEFTFSPPKSCGKLDLAWTGGKAPFVLNIIPIFGSPRNITIPSNSFSNGVGTFSTILALNVSTSVVLAMSDATGFATGGISKRLDLGPDSAGTCDLTPPPLPWSYVNPNSLTQCAHFFFNGFNGTVTPPVQFVGLVPGGSFFILSGTDTIDWLANVPGHTDLIFVGQDAAGRQGGSSDINTVGQSVDNSCLNQSGQDITTTTNVPTSKTATTSQTSASSPTSTSTSTSASGSPTNTSTAPGDSTSHVPLIAGSIAGIVVGLAVIASLGYFCWQHQRKQRNSWDPPNNRQSKRQTVDLLQAPPPPSSYIRSYTSPSTTSLPHNRTASPFDDPPLPAGHEPRPFTLQAPEDPDYAIGAAGVAAGAANSRRISQTTTSTRRTKGPMPNYQPPRLIMHTDIEETEETPNEDGFIELPPQYSAARKPLSSFNGSQSGMSSIPEGSQYSQTPYSGPSHESDPFVSNLSRPSSHESHPPYRAS